MDKVILKPFASNLDNLSVDKIQDFKICMINSDFDIGFKVDRIALRDVLIEKNVEVKCDLDHHACVDIKYYYQGRKRVSIFVFEKGSIVITGANSCNQILHAYNFITQTMYNNYHKIKSIDHIINRGDIRKFLVKEDV